jgi:hypothetical protein
VKNLPPALSYTLLRLALFGAVLLVLVGIDRLSPTRVDILFLALVALLLSGLISYKLLRRQREEMSASIVNRVQRAKDGFRTAQSAEDEADEAARDAAGRTP